MPSTLPLCSSISRLTGAFLLLFSFVVTSGAAEPEPPAVWTLKEAVIFGLQNSTDSRIALQRIESARASQAEADALFRHPRVGLSAAYGQTNNPIYSFGNILNQGVFSNDIDFNAPGRTDNLNLMAESTDRR